VAIADDIVIATLAIGVYVWAVAYVNSPEGQELVKDITRGLQQTWDACYYSKRKGERRWEKGRGDDPFWDLLPETLRRIENDPSRSSDERNRARKIRKMKEKRP
jgi:hypothetical protein